MRGSKATVEQIETMRATYALTRSYTAAAKAAGCSRETAKKYAISEDEFSEVRQQKLAVTIEKIIVKCSEAQEKLLDAIMDDVKIGKASMQEAATAFGIITDKRQLLAGQATTRNENLSGGIDPATRLTPEEMEQAAKIRAKLSAMGPA